jgi:hypothetical protein
MKTKKLIELLQKEDPTGEEEVCIDNADILCLESKPAYWDGCLSVLKRNWDSEYYNVIGAKYVSTGGKINIRSMSVEDAIENNADLPVEYDSDYTKKHFEDFVARCRDEIREISKEIANSSFVEVLKKYKEGWKAAQAIAEPLTRGSVQWWWKPGDVGTRRLYYKDEGADKQISLCSGHSMAVIRSGFFKAVNDGQRIIWEVNV